MGYRDDREATAARVTSLESELAEARAQTAEDAAKIAGLTRLLDEANKNIKDLGGAIHVQPGVQVPKANRIAFAVLAFLAFCFVVATVAAGSHRESDGISMAFVAVPLAGAAIGAHVGRRGNLGSCLASAGGVGVLTLFGLYMFFKVLWRLL